MNENFKLPVPGADYIITYDIPLYDGPDATQTGTLLRGIVVTAVKYIGSQYSGHIEYMEKETGKIRKTWYPWALALDTPENCAKILLHDEQRAIVKREEKRMGELWRDIETLQVHGDEPEEEKESLKT